ncbi:MATA-HMG [Gigaspora margarita]|uniref:MATA-HMG n=1 Tax=Gigaspora margarita TaxID=4874 RepID=A0A8H3X7C8_GIGMA|nr:MATA-HMG [Gigaspora margarita]
MSNTANTVPNSPSMESSPQTLPDSETLPTIRPPFPPVINVEDLISLRESSDGTQMFPSRAPNAFIIYRKQFVKAARDKGYFLPMTVISSMCSRAWENEEENVKLAYKKIARETYVKRKEMYPKTSKRKRKKDLWNIVQFKPKPIPATTNNSEDVKFYDLLNTEPNLFYSNPGYINNNNDINQAFYNSMNYKHESLEFMQFNNYYNDIPYTFEYQNVNDMSFYEPATFENLNFDTNNYYIFLPEDNSNILAPQ